MAPNYQDWLAANVLNEGVIVNYRMLSRALKVHSNAAKEMLYDFHRTQNARKANSLYATYLLTGTKKPTSRQQSNGTASHDQSGDSFISDGLMSSSMPQPDEEAEQIPVVSVTLVAEEHLEAVKQTYSQIASIHVYSLSAGPLSNIQILSDCNRKVATDYASEDPLETWKTYGTIHNPNTKRRTAKRPPPPAAPAAAPTTAGMRAGVKSAAKPTAATTKPAAQPKKPEEKAANEPGSRSGSEAPQEGASKSETKKPAPLRKESSSLFKSFAKTKAPAPEKEDSASEDVSMAGAESEGEEDAEAAEPQDEASKAEAERKAEAARKRKEEAERKMQAMMDASDEEDADALPGIDTEKKLKDQEGDEAMGGTTEAEQVAEETGALDAETAKETEGAEHVTTSNGRRRGRRRVMKKKTTKDAEGYLVTKEEPAWESFSEDEPEPPRKKPAVNVAPTGGAGAKKGAGGGAAKKGLGKSGNIMSFFGKKG